jgi:hypothetical protein
MGLARRCGGDLYEPGPVEDWNYLREKMREAIKKDLDNAEQSSLCDVLMECLDLVNRILILYPLAAEKFKKYSGSSRSHSSLSSRFSDMTIERGGSFDDVDPSPHDDEDGALGGRTTPTPLGHRYVPGPCILCDCSCCSLEGEECDATSSFDAVKTGLCSPAHLVVLEHPYSTHVLPEP